MQPHPLQGGKSRRRYLLPFNFMIWMCCAVLVTACGEPSPDIIKAVKTNSPKKLEKLLDEGADPNFSWGSKNDSLLHWACKRGNLKTVKLLIARSAKLDIRNDDGQTPWDTIWNNHPGKILERDSAILAALLEAGYKPEMKPGEDGQSYLHVIAGRCDNDLLIKILVEKYGAQVEARDNNGWTPLHLATFKSNYGCCQGLIRAGADINAETKKTVERSIVGDEGTEQIFYHYEAGSRPLNLEHQRRTRLSKDLGGLLREAGGTKNPKVHNIFRR